VGIGVGCVLKPFLFMTVSSMGLCECVKCGVMYVGQ
jgi:hypothetical protein